MAITRYLLESTIVGALGGLLFGFDTAVIAGTTQQLTLVYHLTPFTLGLTVFIGLVGTVIGAMSAGVLGQRIGGREALRIMAILYTISALGCAFAWNWPSLMVFRLIGGLGIGGSSVLGPVYIAELAPAKWRGRMVGLFQINVVVGILLAYLSNYLISLLNLGLLQWRWQLGVAGIPSLIFLIMLFRIPRSSRWLVTRNRTDEALAILNMMGSPDSKAELREIMDSIHMERGMASESLFKSEYRLPIFLAVTIGLFNQLAGHQRHPLLLQLHLRVGRLQPALELAADGAGRHHEPGRHPDRHVADRQAGPQDAAADRQRGHHVVPLRRGRRLLHP